MAKKTQPTFYIIDSLSQIFRAYYARASFSNRSKARGAVYIFTRMLQKVLDRGKPDAIVCAFDSRGEGGVRKEYFPDYKANRDPMPEDLAEEMPNFHRIVDGYDIPIIEGGEYEADDVIGTLAKEAEEAGYQVRIISRDKDLKQLLTDNVFLYDADDGSLFGPDELEIDTGLKPPQIVDMLALMGDKVDNIPGAKGIGPKRAQDLLKQHGTLEKVMATAEEVPQKGMRQNLLNFRDQWETSYKLATIITNMDLGFDLDDATVQQPRREQLEPVLVDLGFRSMLDELGWGSGNATPETVAKAPEKVNSKKASKASKSAPSVGPDLFSQAEEPTATEVKPDAKVGKYTCITTKEDLKTLVSQLGKAGRFAFDTETTGLEPLQDELVGISVSAGTGTGAYIPVKAPEGEKTLARDDAIEALRPLLEDPKIGKIGQNLKFDLLVLRKAGVRVRGVEFDTQIAAFLANNSRQQAGMDQLAEELLGYRCIPISALIGENKKSQKRMDQVPLDAITTYASEDADIALRLSEVLEMELEEADVAQLSVDLEMPLVEVLAEMEYAGIAIDLPYLMDLAKSMQTRLDELTKACHEAAGREFTINSPKQLGEILFDELGLTPKGKTSKGKRSTAVDVLEQLAGEHELPKLVLDYRHVSKLLSTYVTALPELADDYSRVHTSFRQAVSTGRLASKDPNVQNIPVRTEEGREIRRAFVAGSRDLRLVVADYSQIELRILAHLSGDPTLQRAFKDGRDIHRTVAAEVHGIDEDAVDSDMRNGAKAVNFGIIYGQSAHGLSQSLGISRGEASDFINAYFERFPKVQEFIEQSQEEAKKLGYASTMLGRRRYISGLNDRNRARQNAALRQAFNTIVQGSAADLIKRAMLRLARKIEADGLPYRLLIQVHDELLLEVPKKDAEAAKKLVIAEMQAAMELDVPLLVEAGIGENWLEAK